MSNEAAERLRAFLAAEAPDDVLLDLDAALADERRATVERIREALDPDPDVPDYYDRTYREIRTILDAEAKG